MIEQMFNLKGIVKEKQCNIKNIYIDNPKGKIMFAKAIATGVFLEKKYVVIDNDLIQQLNKPSFLFEHKEKTMTIGVFDILFVVNEYSVFLIWSYIKNVQKIPEKLIVKSGEITLNLLPEMKLINISNNERVTWIFSDLLTMNIVNSARYLLDDCIVKPSKLNKIIHSSSKGELEYDKVLENLSNP